MTKRQHISYNQILSVGHFFKLFLGSVASFISFPSILIAFLHKIRGVKIKNIKKVYFSFNVFLDGPFPQQIEIGEDVWLTRNVTILTHFNPSHSLLKYYDGIIVKPVKIGDGVFIGVGSIILPGVTIGQCSIIGAGSVVTKDVKPFTVVAGNPAVKIKDIKNEDISNRSSL